MQENHRIAAAALEKVPPRWTDLGEAMRCPDNLGIRGAIFGDAATGKRSECRHGQCLDAAQRATPQGKMPRSLYVRAIFSMAQTKAAVRMSILPS